MTDLLGRVPLQIEFIRLRHNNVSCRFVSPGHLVWCAAVTLILANAKMNGRARRLRSSIRHIRDWPGNSESPYSLALCFALLVMLGFVISAQ